MYDVNYLSKITLKIWKEAKECYERGNYFASLILYGSVLEGLLMSMCFVYPEDVRKTEAYKKVKQRCIKRDIRKRGYMLEFTLGDLLKIGEELNWLPMKDMVEDIGIFENWVRWVKETRNLIHPACWLKPDKYFGNIHKLMKRSKRKTIKKFIEISDETIEGIKELLLAKIMRDINKKIKKYGNPTKKNN